MNCLYITLFFNTITSIVQTLLSLGTSFCIPSHISLLPALWTMSWLLLAPHHRRQTFSQRDVSLGEETSGNHNVTINGNNLFVNFCWTFTFSIEKSYDGTHLAFGGTLDRHCHFKHVSLKQSRFYHCQMSMAHRSRIKVDGSIAIISITNFPIGLHVMYLYFPDTPRILTISQPSSSQNCILSRVTCLRAQRYRVLFLAMAIDVSLLQNIQTSPGPIQHPTQCVLNTLYVG